MVNQRTEGYLMLHIASVKSLPKKPRKMALSILKSSEDNLDKLLTKLHDADPKFWIENNSKTNDLFLYYDETVIADIRRNSGNYEADTNTCGSYLDQCGGKVIQKNLGYVPA